jgi:hypothetical protein
MAKLRKAKLWVVVAVLVVLVVLAVLWATGVLPHMRADAVTAWAMWATVAIALGAAVIGLNQFREVRLTRQEQAQPNVVVYSEPNADVPQILEIIVKNFGTTPAYDVKVTVTPPLKSTPTAQTYFQKIADVPIPHFPILAPGQLWRTVWDSAIERENYMRKLQEEYNKRLWAPCEFKERVLFPRHEAVVTYTDSRNRKYETRAVLDFDMRKGTTFVDIKTIHDLTKELEKQLDAQNNTFTAIHKRLAEFGTEHEGVWIYGSGDDDERRYRRKAALADAEGHRQLQETIAKAQGRYRPPQTKAEDS